MARILIVVPHAISETDPLSADMGMRLFRSLHRSGIEVIDVMFGDIDRKVMDLEAKRSRGTLFRRKVAKYAFEEDIILIDVHSTYPRDDFPTWFLVDVPGHGDWMSKEFIKIVGEKHHGYSSDGNDLMFWWEQRGLPGLMIEFRNDLTHMEKEAAISQVSNAVRFLLLETSIYYPGAPYVW